MAEPSEKIIFVGIDSSDDHHDVCATTRNESDELQMRIANDLDGFVRLVQTLSQRWPDHKIRFGLENPRNLLGRFLLLGGHALYAINPRSVVRTREGLAASGKKDDPLDARTIALLLKERSHQLTPEMPDSPAGTLLAGLVQQRIELVQEKTRLLNQLTATLKSFYPRSLELFASLDQPLTLEFLKAFSGPSSITSDAKEHFATLFAGKRYPQPRRIERLWDKALTPQVPIDLVEEQLGQRRVRHLVHLLEVIVSDLDQIEAEIQAAFDAHPDADFFRSLPGAARVLAPALLVLFGDNRERWRDAQHLATFSGAVPVTRQSGRRRNVQMRRHCSYEARRVLHLYAHCSRRACSWAEEFYQAQRATGKTHAAALRNLAVKWLRIIYRMWRERLTYQEDRYLKSREAYLAKTKPVAVPEGA